ncbi:MAG: ABC transporter substrate-binding protein [Acidimicrobiales bacterium]|nr:ABC transporter substrate-binding protein [Acidimicrobiales bacterium]
MGAQKNRLLTAWLALAAFATLAIACGSGSEQRSSSEPASSRPPARARQAADEGPPQDGGILRFGIDADSDGYNPVANNFALAGNLVASAIFEPLVVVNADRRLDPYLAESVTPNHEGTVWTIKARPGIKFHDGEPFNADAIKINIEQRVKSALSAVALEPVERVEKVDDMTVAVHMKRPWFGYDYTLAAQGGYMTSPKALLTPEGTLNPDFSKKPVGTGPFRFESWQPGNTVTVRKFDGYWQTGKPHLDGIDFVILPDSQSRARALEAGDVDAMVTEYPSDVKRFRDNPSYTQIEDVAGDEMVIMLNEGRPPFDNLNARLALAYATDKRAVIDGAFEGLPAPADQPFTESERWFVSDPGALPHDPQKAAEALERYKQETGEPTLRFELQGRPDQAAMMSILEQQWRELGIEVQITTLEQARYITNVVFGRYQAGIFRNFGYVHPDSNYIFWHSSTAKGVENLSINFTQTRVPELDAALDAARSSNDDALRKEQYAIVVRELNRTVPYIFLMHNVWAIVAKGEVHGLAAIQEVGFGRPDAKTWWNDLWLAPQ